MKKYLEHVYYGYLVAIFLTILDYVWFTKYFLAYIRENIDLVIYRFTLFPFIWAVLIIILLWAIKELFKKQRMG